MRSALLTFVVLISMLGTLPGCTKDAPTTPDPTPKKYAVKGTVTPKASEVVDGIAIAMGTRTATTSSTGAYSFNDVDTGSYVVTPTKTGFTFAPNSKNVRVTASDVTDVDFVATGAVLPTHLVPEMIAIEPGTFMMGGVTGQPSGENARPQHQVTITKGYFIGKTEVTQKQYMSVTGKNPSFHKGDSVPVHGTSALEAMDYCNKLSLLEGLNPCYVISDTVFSWDRNANGYRLPTDAEWEYAARAGTTDNTYDGAIDGRNPSVVLDRIAWYVYNASSGPPYDGSKAKPKAVGLKKSNAWGLFDVLGNVRELTYGRIEKYSTDPLTDPISDPSVDNIILRGSFFRIDASGITITIRELYHMNLADDSVGFRIARNR